MSEPGTAQSACDTFALLLGSAQDGGIPQAGCQKPCCSRALAQPSLQRLPACLGLVDRASKRRWIIDCTPHFPAQLQRLNAASEDLGSAQLEGILLTHAHIGHYAGLIHLGREVMATRNMPVYAMPRMHTFLRTHAPWKRLIERENITVVELSADRPIALADSLKLTPFLVPHRDEDSETVGFRIQGPGASLFYVPDIDSWKAWDRNVLQEITNNDHAFIDATFYDADEWPGRDRKQIPHPTVVDSMKLFSGLPAERRKRIHFFHLNHTNPAADPTSDQHKEVIRRGFRIAQEGQRVDLG
jgi:pyrroloquinoline quinone biosynthesis protein B